MLAVIDHVDADRELSVDNVRNGFLDLARERCAVMIASGVLGVQQRRHSGGPGQAADMSGENSVVAPLHCSVLLDFVPSSLDRVWERLMLRACSERKSRFLQNHVPLLADHLGSIPAICACSVQTATSDFTNAANGSPDR